MRLTYISLIIFSEIPFMMGRIFPFAEYEYSVKNLPTRQVWMLKRAILRYSADYFPVPHGTIIQIVVKHVPWFCQKSIKKRNFFLTSFIKVKYLVNFPFHLQARRQLSNEIIFGRMFGILAECSDRIPNIT